MEILIIINIGATLFTAYWLTVKNKAQAEVITTLKTQVDTLNPFFDILKKFADPSEVEKILDNKLKLAEQDTELKRRQHITQTNEYLQKEWAKRFDLELKPKYEKTYKEFSDFAVLYFSQQNFSDIFERNAQIKMYFPTTADHFISYLDEVIGKPPAL
jgi:hypothetical protein